MTPLTETEIAAFEALAALMRDNRTPWWVIGTAAARLHGAETGPLPEIEVVISPGDARRIEAELGLRKKRKEGTPLLRARGLLKTELAGLPVEMLTWLETRHGGDWRPLSLGRRVPVEVGEALLPVLARDELAAMLSTYGTGRERALAALLQG